MASKVVAKNNAVGRARAQIATVMREALERRGISQSELAAAMGTSRTVVHRLLNGTDYSMNLRTLARAARALNVDLSIRLEES
jgi:transcriptional regulator with XRE-family HTH domain